MNQSTRNLVIGSGAVVAVLIAIGVYMYASQPETVGSVQAPTTTQQPK